jgi:murein DD-endopeptidase MepM/ murein hydrolase activator NlpD
MLRSAPHHPQADGPPATLPTLGTLAELDALLRQRGEGERTLVAAQAAERVALSDLAAIEGTLRRLVAVQADLRLRQSVGLEEVKALEAARTGAITDGVSRPGAADRSEVADELANALTDVHRRLAGLIDRLGEANVEIAHWQGQADSAARRVGGARSRAFDASARLAALQEPGERLVLEVHAQLDALERASAWLDDDAGSLAELRAEWTRAARALMLEHATLLAPGGAADVAVSVVSGRPMNGWLELPLWPPGPVPAYVPARGPVVASLVAAGPPLPDADRRLAEVLPDLGPAAWYPPLAGPFALSTAYGASTPYFSSHWAVDLAVRLGTPVAAVRSGRVEYAGLATPGEPLANFGMTVLVRHGPRLSTLYAHLDAAAFAPAVRAGDELTTGQVLGHVGLTGYSTGPHLHFEARLDNRPIDPRLLLPI